MILNEDLLVSTYHWLHRLPPGLGQWNQASWRCPYGLCFAGWIVVLSGEAEWLVTPDRPHSHRLLATSADRPGSVVRHNGIATVDTYARALRLVGLDGPPLSAEHVRLSDLFDDLAKPSNDLARIRVLLKEMLGFNPHDREPDELVLSTFAKDDWTQAFDPRLATLVADWPSTGCGCPACSSWSTPSRTPRMPSHSTQTRATQHRQTVVVWD